MSRFQTIHGLTPLLLAGLLAGCATSTSLTPQTQRISEYQSDYEQMSPATKEGVARGFISRWDDFKAVYIALGKPDVITSSADGRVVGWTYNSYMPPQTQEQKKVEREVVLQRTNMSDNPLMDTFHAWKNNASRQIAFMRPGIPPRAYGQSWDEYGKYLRERELSRMPEVEDKIQNEKYEQSLYIEPVPDPVGAKLEVIFIEQHVSDAIVDDSYSAFTEAR